MAWTSVYSNDQSGARVSGDIDTLIREIRNGSSIKVVLESASAFPPLSGEPDVYSFVPHTVHVRNGIVFATSTLDVSTRFEGDQLKFQDDSFYYMIIASTKGVLEQIRWSVGEHTLRGHDQDSSFYMQWFVD
jgi:hypothetical protein